MIRTIAEIVIVRYRYKDTKKMKNKYSISRVVELTCVNNIWK